MTSVAILNSRQSKTPAGNDPWVRATLAALDFAAENGWTIVSSLGMNTWELVTWAAGQRRARLRVACPEDTSNEEQADIHRRFDLRGDLVEWIGVTRGEGRSAGKNWWEGRDTEIVSAADILLPVSVRRGGRIDSLLSSHAGKIIDNKFRIPYVTSPHHERSRIPPDHFSPDSQIWPDGWLIHWTRACHGPWPGENESDYYADLAASTDSYCRSAFTTIRRVLTERRLRGSAWRIGSGVPMVAFTELPPLESLKLMRWRSRWSRWSFESYGIAIAKDTAETLGSRPVRYVDEIEWKSIADDDKPFTHRRGKQDDVWLAEREWRCEGGVDLSSIPPEQLRVIVRHASERAVVQSICDHQVIALEAE